MSLRLPEFLDPWRLAEQGGGVEGTVPLARMERLGDLLENRQGDVAFDLRFGRDDKRRPRITGRVRASLALTCQRCLGTLDLPVDVEVDLAVIEVQAEAERLPEACDPLLADNGRVRLLDLLEDELLLAVPQVPMHDAATCSMIEHGADRDPAPATGGAAEAEPERPNPFAALAGLRGDTEH